MKLHLPKGLRAALIAAITAFGFTLPQTYAATVDTTMTTTFSNCAQSDALSVGTANAFGNTDVLNPPSSSITALYETGTSNTVGLQTGGAAGPVADFLTPNTNVGNDHPWTMEMSYTGAESVQSITGMTLSVGLFNASGAWQGSGATWTGDVTFTATITAGGQTATYTGLLFNGSGGGHGQGDTKFAVTLSGDTIDLSDVSEYTLKLELTETLQSGTFVGLQNIGYNVVASLPEIGEYTWEGTSGEHAWSAAVWNDGESSGQNFSDGSDAIFGAAGHKEVSITNSPTARFISVNADGYTFNVEGGQTLSGRSLTIADGCTLTVTGEGALDITEQLVGTGALALGNSLSATAGSLAIASGKTFSVSGENALLSVNTLTNAGTLGIGEGTRVTVSNNISVAGGSTFTTSGSGMLAVNTFAVSGGTVTIGSNLEVTGGEPGTGATARKQGLYITNAASDVKLLGALTNITGAMYANAGTVTVGDGTHAARVETNRIEFGDSQGGEVSTLNIMKEATVHVKGADSTDFGTTGLLLGEWAASSEANIHGKLYGDNTTAYVGDMQATINIEDGGVMAVKGIGITANKSGKSQILIVNLNDGGKLVLGENGMTSEKPLTATFGDAEVGVSASDVEIGAAITLNGTTGTTFNTAMYTWTGQGDSLELAAGEAAATLTVSGNITGDGTIIKTGDGTLMLAGDNNALTHTISLQAGTLDVTTAVLDISNMGGITVKGYSDGQITGNGYATMGGTVDVVAVGDGTTLSHEGVQVTFNGTDVTMDDNGDVTLEDAKSLTTFYVNVDGSTESLANAVTKGGGELTTVSLADNTKLAADQAADLGALVVRADASADVELSKDVSFETLTVTTKDEVLTLTGAGTLSAGVLNGPGTISIGDDAVLSVTTATVGTAKPVVTGGGTLAVTNGTLTAELAEAWTGTVRVANTTKGDGASAWIDTLANGNSLVEFINFTGYDRAWASSYVPEIAADIKLTSDGANAAWNLTAFASQTYTMVLTGDWQGDGTFQMSGGSAGQSQAVEYKGDISKWTGSIEANAPGMRRVTFSENATAVNVSLVNNGTGAFELVVNNAATFSKAVNVSKLSVEAGQSATFQANTTVGQLAGSGSIVKTGTDTTMTVTAAAGTGTAVTALDISVNEGTLKATAAGALGSGPITVAPGAVLDLVNGGALGTLQTVTSSGNVILHDTLTSGTVDGGVLTLSDDFAVEGDLVDVEDSDTGNGFSQGGVMHVYDTDHASLANITDIVHGDTHYELSDVNPDGDISMSGADWSTYQLNGEAQYAVQAIMDFAAEHSGTLAHIMVNADDLELTNDSTTLKTSMLGGEHLATFSVYMSGTSNLTIDSDCAVDIGTSAGANATLTLEKDATVGDVAAADQDNMEAVQLTIKGKGHTLKIDGLGVAFDGTLTIDEGVKVEMAPQAAFSTIGNATMELKEGSSLALGEVTFATLDGGTEASIVVTSDEYLPMYDPAFAEYSVTGMRITFDTTRAYNLGHVIDATSQIVNAGTGSLNDVSANAEYAELNAQGGNIYISTPADSGTDTRELTVGNLTLADGRTVGEDTGKAVTITVTGTADLGSGARVCSALTMAAGSTLDADGPIAMADPNTMTEHALSLEGGINIGDTLWSTLSGLPSLESTNLFTGVSALTLAGEEFTEEVDLNSIFDHASLKDRKFKLGYKDGNVIVSKLADNNRYWQGGDDSWDYTATVWTNDDGEPATFSSGYNAYFASTSGGTVTLGTDITADSITVSGADYIFAPGSHTLTVNQFVEADGHKATFNMDLIGENLKLIAKNGGTIILQQGGSVKDVEIGSGSTIKAGTATLAVAGSLKNNGSLSAGTLTLSQGTAQGGNVDVAALNLADNKSYTFGNLTAGTISGTEANLTIGSANTLAVSNNSTVAGLTLGDNATVAGTGTLKTAGVTLQGDATVSGKLTTGTLAGSDSTLKINGGTLTASLLGNEVNLATSGTSTIASSGLKLVLNGTVDNTADGTVTFVGSFDVGKCTTVDGTATYVGGDSTANGFKQAQKIVSVIDEGTADGTDATLTYNGTSIGKMGTNGKVTFQGDTEYDKFYVNSGSEKASKALDNEKQQLGTFELAAGTTLVVDHERISMGMVNAAGAATMQIESGYTVTTDGTAKNLTLTGGGTLAVDEGKTSTGVTLGGTWAGTVSYTEAQLTTLGGSWKSGSTVSLTGITGSLGSDLIEGKVVLKKGTGDWGFGQTETSGTQYTNLENTLTGDGNLGVKSGSVDSTFNLNGNIDGWTGNFIVATDADTDLNLGGSGPKTVHGTVGGSNLVVNVNADTTFEGALSVAEINVNDSKTATLKADSTADRVNAYSGFLKVDNGKTLTVTGFTGPEGLKLGAGASIVLQGTAYMGGEDYGYVGGTVANGTTDDQDVKNDNANITVTGATLRVNGGPGFTVDNKLVNATLAVENGLPSTVTLNNVQDSLEVAGNLEIGPGGLLKVAQNNGTAKQTLNISDGTTLTLADSTTLDADLTLNRGATLKLDYNMGTPVATTLNGGGLTLYKGLTLSGDLYETLKGLSTEGESVTLFSNVDTIVFDGATTATVDASTYFTNLLDLEGDYTFNYGDGLLSIVYSESSSRQLVWDGTETEHRWVAYEPEAIDPEVKDWYQPSTSEKTHFAQGDTATFGAAAETKVVNLSAGETVAKMVTLKESADYEFVADAAGSKLSATRFEVKEGATLNKSGAGTLILEVGENVTVDAAGFFVDEGELVIGTAEMPGTLALDNGVMEVAEDATLRVAKIQDSEGSLIAVCGTLNVASGSLHAIHALERSTLVISNVNGVAAGTLSIDSDTTLHGLENHGTLDVGMHALTLAETAAQGGNVTAGTLNLAENGNAFGNLKVNTIHYAYGAEGAGELGAVNVDTIAANGAFPVITLDLTDTMGNGGTLAPANRTSEATTYTLVHADGQTLSTSNFMLGGNTLALLVQNGLVHEGAGLETDGSNITLTVGGQDVTWYTDKDVTEWGYTVLSGDHITAGGDTFNGVEHMVVDASRRIDVTGAGSEPGLRVRNISGLDGRTITFTGTEDDTVNLITNEETASNVNIAAENIKLQVGLNQLDDIDPTDYEYLHVGGVSLTNADLAVNPAATLSVDTLNGDVNSGLEGVVIVEAKGGVYNGGYEDATVILHENADQTLAADEGLTVMGLGLARLTYIGTQAHMGGIEGIGLRVMLNDVETDNSHRTLTLDNEYSYIKGGALGVGLSAIETGLTLDTEAAPDLLRAEHLEMSGSTLYIYQALSDGATLVMDVNDHGYKRNLLLAMLGGDDTTADAVRLQGDLFSKYYQNPRLENGRVLVDRRTNYYTLVTSPTSVNGRAGAGMLDDALLHNNPQATQQGGDLAVVMTELEQGGYTRGNADRVMAAMSGASQAALGAAWNHDVERQLRAIRNRTTQMGLAECTKHEGLPYFNAWINAEGDYSKLSADGTLAGYKLTSWGGTVGVDVDCTNRLTLGLALTAMSGDFTAESADQAKGDLDRMYVTVFGRYTHRAWTHTFLATLGLADTKLNRTVDYGYGNYDTSIDSDGKAFGIMYELGYVAALNDDASTCIQPLVNISYRTSSLDGGTERSKSDAALRLGDAKASVFTVAAGARLQSTIGTSVYNRATLFEGRVLLKADAGDRDAEASNGFVGVPARRTTKSAKMGAFGVEVGAGITIPISENAGALFLDFTGDFRNKYTEINGTVGYRFNF
ncbi:MAG: hypothetical protein MJ058_01700 [Akkermansia sp.]|nr:hypothetical protein [Akkermansia sp.]